MAAVSGFTMISGLLIIILERANMIGILKALGANNTSIRKIFLYVSVFLVGKGMIWGNIIGVVLCLIQRHFNIETLNPEAYNVHACIGFDVDRTYLFGCAYSTGQIYKI